MPFSTDPHIEVLDSGKFRNISEFVYDCYIDGDHYLSVVEEGFECDLASIPWFIRWLIPKLGKYNDPALVHDKEYRLQQYPRPICDTMLLLACQGREVKQWICIAIYIGVRAGGWWAWHKNKVKNGD